MKKTVLAITALTVLFVRCGGKGDMPKTRGAGTADTLLADTAATYFTDSRDGKTYRTVKIGGQVWMAENLNFKTDSSKCYDNIPDSCAKYGRLYNWNDALTACPNGWHLPTDAEWDVLMVAVGGIKEEDEHPYCNTVYWKTAGKKLKSTSGWETGGDGTDGNGTDDYGFSALPGGYVYFGGYSRNVGYGGSWWSATEDDAPHAWEDDGSHAWSRNMYCCGSDDVARGGCNTSKVLKFSVRCVQD